MGDVLNIFTKQLTEAFGSGIYDKKVTLTAKDKAYFAVLSFNKKEKKPLHTKITEYPPEIEDDGWAEVPVPKDGPTRIDFQFLEDMGLAVQRDDKHYINKFAYFLYDPQDGLFMNYRPKDTPRNKKEAFAPFMRTLLAYVLPGEYWMTYHDEQLSDDLRKTKLIEIESSWNDIASEYGSKQESNVAAE